jgi:hypothetical protein
MSDGKLAKLVEGTKHHTWKWLGALILKPKDDGKGGTSLAVSLTKVQKLLALAMSCALFVAMLVLWIAKPELVTETQTVTDPIPSSMLMAFYALLGINGAYMTAGAIALRGKK